MTDETRDTQDLTNEDGDETKQTEQQEQRRQQQEQQEPEEGGVDVFSSQQALAAICIRLNQPAPSASASPPASASAASAAASSSSAAVAPAAAGVSAVMPSLHLLPCRIAHTGPANVPNYFQPERSTAATNMLTYSADGSVVQQVDSELYDARFRGRQLTGAIIQLPQSAKGFIFEEDHTRRPQVDADDSGEASDKEAATQQTTWKTGSTFDSLLLWQPDQELFERKHVREVIEDWTLIAHAIHDPIAE